AGLVESTQAGRGPALRDRRSRGKILGKPRVEVCRERQACSEPMAAGHMAYGALGGDMDGVRVLGDDAPRDRTGMRQREANFGVGRQRNGLESIRGEETQLRPERHGRASNFAQRLDDAVDLRVPCIGCDQNADRAARIFLLRDNGPAACVTVVQPMTSSLPSACSATAVQLSTQSPQLT